MILLQATAYIKIHTLYFYGDRLWKGQTKAIPGHTAVLSCILFLYVMNFQCPIVENSNTVIDLEELLFVLKIEMIY